MPIADTSLERALGQLEGAVTALTSTVNQQNASATEARGKLFASMEQMRHDLNHLDNRVDAIERVLEKLTPHVTEFAAWQEQIKGAGKFGKGVWMVAGFLVGIVAWLWGLFSYVATHWPGK